MYYPVKQNDLKINNDKLNPSCKKLMLSNHYVKKKSESPQSFRSEIINKMNNMNLNIANDMISPPDIRINNQIKEINNSEMSPKDDECLNRLESRIVVTKGNELVLNSMILNKAISSNEQMSIILPKLDRIKSSHVLMKDLLNVKLNKNSHFMERMYLDIFKRQTKEERLLSLVKKTIRKSPEKSILSTFNRLILDTNRRIEKKHKIELMSSLQNDQNRTKSQKKYNKKQWKDFYYERFTKPEESRKKIAQELIEKKQKIENEKEDLIISEMKNKKEPQTFIDNVIKRVYTDSIQRKNLLKGYNSHSKLLNNNTVNNKCKGDRSNSKEFLSSTNKTISSTDMPATFFKTQSIPIYNFTEFQTNSLESVEANSDLLEKLNKNVINKPPPKIEIKKSIRQKLIEKSSNFTKKNVNKNSNQKSFDNKKVNFFF